MAYMNSIERYERQVAREEGLVEGLEKGLQQGSKRTATTLLKKLIQLKFGALPDWAEQRLQEATQDQLTDWVTATLTADSLESMLSYE